jgi:hypothetical protein
MAEKVSYTVFLLYFAIFAHEVFFLTLAAETLFCMLLIIKTADRGSRLKYAAMLLPAMPVRLLSLGVDMFAMLSYMADMAVGNREWRK